MSVSKTCTSRRGCLAAFILAISFNAHAYGWGDWGEVTRIEVIRANGLLIFGDFGNVNSCTSDTAIFLRIDHPQYKELYSMMLTAMTTGFEIRPYLRECQSFGWHSGTYNTVTGSDAIYLKR